MLEAGSVVPQDDHRAGGTYAKEPDRRPYQQRPTDPVPPGRQKNYTTTAVLGGLVYGVLNRIRVIRAAIAFSFDSDRTRVIRR
jgi:hypothetical protein